MMNTAKNAESVDKLEELLRDALNQLSTALTSLDKATTKPVKPKDNPVILQYSTSALMHFAKTMGEGITPKVGAAKAADWLKGLDPIIRSAFMELYGEEEKIIPIILSGLKNLKR